MADPGQGPQPAPVLRNEPKHRHPWPGTRLPGAVRAAQRWLDSARLVGANNRGLDPAARTLAFFPMRPNAEARISLIVAQLGLRIGTQLVPGSPTIAWDNGTWFSAAAARRLPADAINGQCLDISKSHVDRVWADVAGYSADVDPLTFEGAMVVKSEHNGRHDGRIVQGPLRAPRAGRVYQRFVPALEGDQLVDLRTTVIGGQIAVLIRRYHSQTRWYLDSPRNDLTDPSDEFSTTEQAQILRFTAQMGMDYGELDVLRDRDSGRIYVLDANRTPYGPAYSETNQLAKQTTLIMAEAFRRLLEARWP